MAPGAMVRLKSAYIVKCESFKKDDKGNITEIHCTYIPESKSGSDTSGINVKGTIHWLSAKHAAKAEVRLYERLFTVENPAMEEGDFKNFINPNSLEVIKDALVEPHLLNAKVGEHFQFIRNGYFCVDTDSKAGSVIFNRTVTLKDGFKKN